MPLLNTDNLKRNRFLILLQLRSICLYLLLSIQLSSIAASFYVSPTGTPGGNGSINNPWDLQTAFNHPSTVRAGDTIWLRGGNYTGVFTSNLQGSASAPIIVRQYPGERAIITDTRQYFQHGTLNIYGSWTYYWGFEIRNTYPNRIFTSNTQRPMGLHIKAPHTKFINLVVHDTGNGFGFWTESQDAEIYGCIVFNCGTTETSSGGRGHGHAIYTQNDVGTKILKDNILFNQYGWGIHAYPNPGGVKGFDMEGNICFNNGILHDETKRFQNIEVGGYQPYGSERIRIEHNYTYHSLSQIPTPHSSDVNACIGCTDDADNKDVIVRNNYFAGGLPVSYFRRWKQTTVTNNTFFGKGGLAIIILPSSFTPYSWDQNLYYAGGLEKPFYYSGTVTDFNGWKNISGLDANSTYNTGSPAGIKVFIRPNQYESGRAHIAIYNWDSLASVPVDLSQAGLKDGQKYEIRDVQNLFGPPVISGNFNATNPIVDIPMNNIVVTAPIGRTAPAHTGRVFSAFLVTTTSELSISAPSEKEFTIDYYFNEVLIKSSMLFTGSYEIIAVDGRIIKRESINNKMEERVNVAALPRGFYMVRLFKGSRFVQSKKFIR